LSRQHLPVGRLLRFDVLPGFWLVVLLLSQLGRATPAQAAPGSAGSPHGKLSIECATCHSSEAWTPTRIAPSFDHAALGFNLEGPFLSSARKGAHDPSQFFGTYDLDRTVTRVHQDRNGRIVIDLAHGYNVPGASTLAWANDISRNIVLTLKYTITQKSPITLRSGNGSFLISVGAAMICSPVASAGCW